MQDTASKRSKNQNGVVAIMVVATITIVLSLLTVAFTRVMGRNLRQALDRDLASQAYYAAESGVNDARAFLIAGNLINPINATECLQITGDTPIPFKESISGDYNSDPNDNVAKYPCVLIDDSPKELQFIINPGESKLFSTTTANLRQMYFGWENSSYIGIPKEMGGASRPLPQESVVTPASNITGLLRVAIYPVPAGLQADPNPNGTLIGLSKTFFLYPSLGSGIGSLGYKSGNGDFVNGNCSLASRVNSPIIAANIYGQASGRFCNSQIGVPGDQLPDAQKYYVRLTAVYRPLIVSVWATQAIGGNPTADPLTGAQAVIDVTGEGNDVLRRVQVRVPLDDNFPLPETAIQSIDTLCKRFRLPKIGPGPNDYGPAEDSYDQTDAIGSDSEACKFR